MKTVFESILYSTQSLTILTANSSLYSKSKLRFAIVFLLFVLNHSEGMYGIRNLMRHGISLQRVWNQCQLHCMESRPKEGGIHGNPRCHTPKGVIPYNSLCELMPYTSPSVLNKNNLNRKNRFRLFLVTPRGCGRICYSSDDTTNDAGYRYAVCELRALRFALRCRARSTMRHKNKKPPTRGGFGFW